MKLLLQNLFITCEHACIRCFMLISSQFTYGVRTVDSSSSLGLMRWSSPQMSNAVIGMLMKTLECTTSTASGSSDAWCDNSHSSRNIVYSICELVIAKDIR
eukprot:355150-Chlamydomonas_euryale.AAC.2